MRPRRVPITPSVKKEKKVFRFGSWGELMEFADKREAVLPEDEFQNASRKKVHSNDEFYGTKNWDAALKLAVQGWPEGTNTVARMAASLADKVTSLVEKEQLFMDTTGMAYDIGLVNMGVPEAWINVVPYYALGSGRRVVKIVFNAAASCGVEQEVMIRKGASVAVLIQALEQSGFRCEVVLGDGTGGRNVDIEVYSLIKEASQPLDIDRLVFSLAHPSTLRRVMFSVYETYKQFMETDRFGYGTPITIAEQGDVYVGHSMYGDEVWEDEQKCVQWILESLKSQGVRITV